MQDNVDKTGEALNYSSQVVSVVGIQNNTNALSHVSTHPYVGTPVVMGILRIVIHLWVHRVQVLNHVQPATLA